VSHTVLIVDDHAGFRRFAKRLLEAGGLTVIAAEQPMTRSDGWVRLEALDGHLEVVSPAAGTTLRAEFPCA
jgi:CheY-like chemotaxis protein